MGNKSLNQIKIKNYPDVKDDLIISTSTPEKDKEAVSRKTKFKTIKQT